MKNKKEFWIIGIGASAGGLEALSAFFRSLPENPNAAFVVAQHLAPHSKSMMVELIARQTKLPVVSVQNEIQIEKGVISIVPPNFDVTAHEGELLLTPAGLETRPKPSVDTFFESLAKVYGRRAVGIILSGTGSDGSVGIRAIKENGGITLVQDAESAKYDGMPKSAIETGMVDQILGPEEMAQNLMSLLSKPHPVVKPKEIPIFEQNDFNKILQYLKKEIGSDFSQYKISTIQRRIEKRIGVLRKNSLSEYYDYLQGNSEELLALSQNMLVSVTSFFRDTEAFEAITVCLREIISQKTMGEELRLWSAGCATGEEAYSLAMIISEEMEKAGKRLSVKIFATDMDYEALSHARNGIYTTDDVRDLDPALVTKYLERRDKFFEFTKAIKEMIVFAKQDLIQNPPFVKLDLVACRNVMIYFDSALQAKVFEIFHYALKSNGILFLGKSESAPNSYYEIVDRKEKIFRRLNVLPRVHRNGKYTLGTNIQPLIAKKRPQINIGEAAPLELIKLFNLSGVIIDSDSTIVQIIGDVTPYISLPTGTADFRLLNLLDKNVMVEFSVMLKKAEKENKVIKSRSYGFAHDPEKHYSILVKPMEFESSETRTLFIVSFESKMIEVTDAHTVNTAESIPARLVELEQEVAATKENLQTVIEELEISNEELQSLNEELSSTNEELQASNEELETTNEELQSTNEELTTVNEELNTKSSELRVANTSMENILSSVPSPTVVVDKDLRIIRYNSSSNLIFNLSVNDLGNRITDASCQCEIPNFEKMIRDALHSGKVAESICETKDRIFQLRIHPSRDEFRNIVGAIIIFFDNTDFLNSQDKLKTSDKRIRAIVDSSPTLISLKDPHGRYLMANESFLQHYNLKEEDLIGASDREIFNEELANSLRENDLEVFLKRKPSEKQETFSFNGKRSTFLSNRFPLFGDNERTPYAVGVVSLDITEQVLAQRFLEASENRYRAIVEDQAVFVCRYSPDGHISFGNKSFVNYFGTITGKNFLDLIDKKEQHRVSKEIEKITFELPIVQYEHRSNNAGVGTSSERWIRWIHRGIFDEQANILEYQAVGFDVTDIHKQTAELLAKESLYTHVLEHTSDYLSVYLYKKGEFYLETFNQSTANNRSRGNARLIGKNLRDLMDTTESESIIEKYKRSVETNAIATFDEKIDGPGGLVYLSTTIVPMIDNATNEIRVVSISRDITKLKRTEKALREEKRNADAANKAKSDFLASMSYELRTPLNVIMGMSQLLSRRSLAPENVKLVESIQRSGKVLLSLIEDVLDLSKIEAGKISFDYRPFDLNLLLGDVVQAFDSLATQKGIRLLTEINIGEGNHLIGDQVRVKQVLLNLVGNALKFTEKGSVTLKVSLVNKTLLDNTVYFEVKDTGIGIPEESFPKIFKRFSQADSGTSRKFGGTGLGLSISKQLVELMNGSIGFSSEEGVGSTFWFRMTFNDAVANEKKIHEQAPADQDFSDLRLLVVDDNPEALKVLGYFFDELKSKVDLAGNGEEALKKLDQNQYDVILMDMQMPVLDGLETTRIIRTRNDEKSKIPVIALTANAMNVDRQECLAAGMNDYLSKPVDFDQLKMMLMKWV